MKNGIKLLLEPGTRVRDWIRFQTLNVEIGRKQVNGRDIRFVKIHNGEASFIPGGNVDVKMPGSSEFRVAFQPREVLEIRDLKEDLIERNHYLCTECFTLTGKRENTQDYDSSIIATGADNLFKCTQCGHQWNINR